MNHVALSHLHASPFDIKLKKKKRNAGRSQVFGHVSQTGASLFLAELLRQRCKLLNWLGIGLSETGLCNNVKVVKPLGHL